MPYILKKHRPQFDSLLKEMYEIKINSNNIFYMIYMYCKRYITPSYKNYRNYIGEILCCAAEIKRKFPEKISKGLSPVNFDKDFSYIDIAQYNLVTFMRNYNIEVNGDLNYILFAYFVRYIKEDFDSYIMSIYLASSFIIDTLLAPYEDKKIEENGDIS